MTSIEDRLKTAERRIEELSGELLATRIVSSVALDWLVASIPDSARRTAQVQTLAGVVDTAIRDTVLIGSNGDADARTKAIAQARADEVLSKISAMRTKP